MGLDLSVPWDKQPVVVIDFEATSTDPTTAMPVEVAIVRFEGGKYVSGISTLLNPGMPIPAESTAIHGITDEMVADRPSLADVAHGFEELCSGAIPVAYNAPYDRKIMHRFYANTSAPVFDPEQAWLDVFVIIASPEVDKFTSGSGRLKLSAACQRWGVEIDGAHRARADAMATGQLLFKLLEKGMVKSVALGQLLKHTQSTRADHEADFERFRKKCLAEDRQIWRQYACAALASRLGAFVGNECQLADVKYVSSVADELLALEKAKFLGVKS